MQRIELNAKSIAAAAEALPHNTPVVMLNLLRYRADAGDGLTGRQVYFERYLPAFAKIAAQSEATMAIRPVFIGNVKSILAGVDGEEWDDVAMVEYPNFAAFQTVVDSSDYRNNAAPHREAALEDFRLLALVQQPQR